MLLKEKLTENIFQKMADKNFLSEFLTDQQDILYKKLIDDYGNKIILYDDFSVDEIVDLIIFYCKDKWTNMYELLKTAKPIQSLTNNKTYDSNRNNTTTNTAKISSYDSEDLTNKGENNIATEENTNYTITSQDYNKNFLKDVQNYNKNLYFTSLSDTILIDIDNLINTSLWG